MVDLTHLNDIKRKDLGKIEKILNQQFFSKQMFILSGMFLDYDLETHSAFACAALYLGGNLIHFTREGSSKKKGESDLDMLRILMLNSEIVIVRDLSKSIEEYVKMAEIKYNGMKRVPIINGGDLSSSILDELYERFEWKYKKRDMAAGCIIYCLSK